MFRVVQFLCWRLGFITRFFFFRFFLLQCLRPGKKKKRKMQKSENNPRWKQIGWVLHWVSIDCVPRFVSVGVCFFPACYMLTPHLMSLFLLTVLFVFFFSILTLVAETTTCIITWFDACVSKKKNLIFFFKFF